SPWCRSARARSPLLPSQPMLCACDRYAIVAARQTRSGGEALDGPAGSLAAVAQPVVQPVGPALPELHDVVPEPVAAPEAGHGHGRARGPALLHPRVTVVEHGARGDHRRLPACPRAELGGVRAGMEVWLALALGQGRDRALDDHLATQRVPGE